MLFRSRPGMKPVNSIWVRRVLIDDETKVLYKREEDGSEFFYLRHSSPDYTTTEDKVLYAFVNTNEGRNREVVFLDKYNLEWDLRLPTDIMGMTRQGIPIVRYGEDMGGPSDFVYHNPASFYMPSLVTPSIHTPRPTPSAREFPLRT